MTLPSGRDRGPESVVDVDVVDVDDDVRDGTELERRLAPVRLLELAESLERPVGVERTDLSLRAGDGWVGSWTGCARTSLLGGHTQIKSTSPDSGRFQGFKTDVRPAYGARWKAGRGSCMLRKGRSRV